MLKELRELRKDLSKSLEVCHEKLDDQKSLLEDQRQQLLTCLNQQQELQGRVVKLEKENVTLKQKMNDLEQYGRKNSIEIHGVPYPKKTSMGLQPKENIIEVVHRIGIAIGFKFEPYTIDACHRLRSAKGKAGTNPEKPPGIILKFTRRMDKEEFLRIKKTRPQLSTRHVKGYEHVDQPIYIGDSLTQYNRFLLSKAKAFAKNENMKYTWFNNGKILMRKNEGSRVFVIASEEDLKTPIPPIRNVVEDLISN